MKPFAYTGSAGPDVDPKMLKEIQRLSSWSGMAGQITDPQDIAYLNASQAWNAYSKGLWDGQDAIKVAVSLRLIDASNAMTITNEDAIKAIQIQADEENEEHTTQARQVRAAKQESPSEEVELSVDEKLKKQRSALAKARESKIIDARTGQPIQVKAIESRSPSNIGYGDEKKTMDSDANLGQPMGQSDRSGEEEREISKPREDIDRDNWLTKIKNPKTNKPEVISDKPVTTLNKYEPDTKVQASMEIDQLEQQLKELEQKKTELQQRKAEQLKQKVDQICDFIEKIDSLPELTRIYETSNRVYTARKG